jgi:hypothetical protein
MGFYYDNYDVIMTPYSHTSGKNAHTRPLVGECPLMAQVLPTKYKGLPTTDMRHPPAPGPAAGSNFARNYCSRACEARMSLAAPFFPRSTSQLDRQKKWAENADRPRIATFQNPPTQSTLAHHPVPVAPVAL